MLGKISGIDMVAREAHFHEHCRKSYVSDDSRNRTSHQQVLAEPDISDDTFLAGSKEQREAYAKAFEALCSYISQHVVNGGSVVRMSTLLELYLEHILTNSPQFYNPDHKTQKLKAKIQRHCGELVQFWQPNNKSDLVYSAGVCTGAAVEVAFESATSESEVLCDAALILHRSILSDQSQSPKMPWPPSGAFLTFNTIVHLTALQNS